MDYPDIRSGKYTRVPMYRELEINSFDFMSLLKAMDARGYCIFLESASKTKEKGRFSFLCFNPVEIVSEEDGAVRIAGKNGTALYDGGIFRYLDMRLSEHVSPVNGKFGDFNGGYAGYSGTTSVSNPAGGSVSAEFMLVDEFVVFDNHTGKYHVCSVVYPDTADIESTIRRGEARLAELEQYILDMIAGERIHFLPSKACEVKVEPVIADGIFMEAAARVRDMVADNSMPLTAVSREFYARGEFSAYSFYLKLRGLSPSPYMYYMNFPHCRIAGSSPETHLKIRNRAMMMKPASGFTVVPQSKHGKSAVKRELLRSEDEKGVHSVLVDLARDGLYAFAEDGSVKVKKFMEIEEYQNRLRIVSKINGILRPEAGIALAFSETLQSCMMAWIRDCAACVDTPAAAWRPVAGYFGFNRSCDTCVMTGFAVFETGRTVIHGYAIVHAASAAEDVLASAAASAAPAVKSLGFAGGM